jgi:hypothetical protein
MFYVMSKQFFIFWSPFSFNSAMPNWDFEANMLSDRWPTTFRSIWHPRCLSWLWRNHLWLFIQNPLESSEFFKRLVYILHDFRVEIVRWGSSFQSINLCEYFKLVKYPACFITIRSVLKMMITSVLSNVRRELSRTMGSEISQSSVDYGIYSTRFFFVFSSGLISISNWMLSLE